MSDYIKDTSNKDVPPTKNEEKHFEKFGVYPFVIGMFWNDSERLEINIVKSIETNKPYNEYKLLSDEEQRDFDNGILYF
tara:strand:- start:2086 stop:2322 length:237 start_codon:yes stop_codon:yes gene_type:complete